MDLDALIEQIDCVLGETSSGVHLVQVRRAEPKGDGVLYERMTRYASAIERYAPPESVYRRLCDEILRLHEAPHNTEQTVERLRAVLIAFKDDVLAAGLFSTESAIHSSVFLDMLRMAEGLLRDSYKDAATVIGGTVLAEHLRKMCEFHGLSLDWVQGDSVIPKNVHQMNNALREFEAYGSREHEIIEAMNMVRLKALYSKTDEYTAEESRWVLSTLRDFIVNHPA